MALFLLKAEKYCRIWEPWYDKNFGYVIRAMNETEARALAQEKAADEKHAKNGAEAWLNDKYSSCEFIGTDVAPVKQNEILLTNFASG